MGDATVLADETRCGAQADKEFRIGLALAGAISAGAYTAGVIDFLVEALEAWEQVRGEPGVPDHRTGVKHVARASPGGNHGRDQLNRAGPWGAAIRWTVLSDLIRHDQVAGWGLPPSLAARADPARTVLAELASPAFDYRTISGLRGWARARCAKSWMHCLMRRVIHVSPSRAASDAVHLGDPDADPDRGLARRGAAVRWLGPSSVDPR